MAKQTQPENPSGHRAHGAFERRDIGIGGVLYFLAILAVGCLATAFLVNGLYHYLENWTEAQQPPVSPLVTNPPKDTRKLPIAYPEYLKQNFPTPQLEISERDQLNQIRSAEDEKLASYDWVDQQGGPVRIPIDRAMDLIAERGLPVHEQAGNEASSLHQSGVGAKNKGSKK